MTTYYVDYHGSDPMVFPPSPWVRYTMTDLDKFVALYKDFGIDCTVNNADNFHGGFWIRLSNGYQGDATTSSKIGGYSFFVDVEFDTNGKFIKQEFGE